VYLNIGNHEIGYERAVPPAIYSLAKDREFMHVADYKKDWTHFTWHGLNIYMIPYFKEAIFNQKLQALLESEVEQPACLCIHQNIKGIQVGDAVLQDGMTGDEICSVVKKKFNFIICGHIHHASYSTRYKLPLLIPGSTVAYDFKDQGSQKSFFVLDFNEDYTIEKCTTVKLEGQADFFTIDWKEADKYSDRDIGNCLMRVEIPVGQDFEPIRQKLSHAFEVKPKWTHDGGAPDLSGYQRPVRMGMNDWLVKYMQIKGYHDSEIESARVLNEALFKKEAKE
jgi:hypothetical protein